MTLSLMVRKECPIHSFSKELTFKLFNWYVLLAFSSITRPRSVMFRPFCCKLYDLLQEM